MLKNSEQNQLSEQEDFEKLLSERKEDIAVLKIRQDIKQVLRSKLQSDLPSERQFNHHIKVPEGTKAPFRKFISFVSSGAGCHEEVKRDALESGKSKIKQVPICISYVFCKVEGWLTSRRGGPSGVEPHH